MRTLMRECLDEHEQRHEDGAAAVGRTGHGGDGRDEYECWAGLELGSWILECVV